MPSSPQNGSSGAAMLAVHHLQRAWLWACAQLALAQAQPVRARVHAAACTDRPSLHTPQDLAAGAWWHGLWQVWLGLNDPDRAEAARAEGVAWIQRTLQRELAPEFHASFREAVPAHRALLSG